MTAGTAIANGTGIPAVSRPRKMQRDDEDLQFRTEHAAALSVRKRRTWARNVRTIEKHSAATPIAIASRGIQSGVSR